MENAQVKCWWKRHLEDGPVAFAGGPDGAEEGPRSVVGGHVCHNLVACQKKVEIMGKVDNIVCENIENLTSKKWLKSGELKAYQNFVPRFQLWHIAGHCQLCVSTVPPAGLGKGVSAPGRTREGDG